MFFLETHDSNLWVKRLISSPWLSRSLETNNSSAQRGAWHRHRPFPIKAGVVVVVQWKPPLSLIVAVISVSHVTSLCLTLIDSSVLGGARFTESLWWQERLIWNNSEEPQLTQCLKHASFWRRHANMLKNRLLLTLWREKWLSFLLDTENDAVFYCLCLCCNIGEVVTWPPAAASRQRSKVSSERRERCHCAAGYLMVLQR